MTSWVSGTGYDDARRQQRRVAARDDVDWAEIYSAYLPRVRSYVRGRVPSAWVEDTAQDTFVRAFRSRQRFDGSRPVWPWLVTIARRACIETCRAHPIEVPFDLAIHGAIAPEDPHVELERRMQAQAIDGALHMVSPRHRHLLVTYEMQGRAFASLADEERITRQALKSALCRARESFRTHYATLAERRGLAALPVVGPLVARLRRWRRALGLGTLPLELASVVVVGVGATALFVGMPSGSGMQTAVVVGAGEHAVATSPVDAARGAPVIDAPSSPTADGVTVGRASRGQGSHDANRPAAVRVGGRAGIAVTPEASTATIGVDWDDPLGSADISAGVTLHCAGTLSELACTVARATPVGR